MLGRTINAGVTLVLYVQKVYFWAIMYIFLLFIWNALKKLYE